MLPHCFVLRPPSLLMLLLLCLACLVPLCAHAQDTDVSIIWAKDSTVQPPVSQVSRSGALGGLTTVHIRFKLPPYPTGPWLVTYTLDSLVFREVAGHVPPMVLGPNTFHTASARPECGDTPQSGEMYWEGPWYTTGGWHNGPHTVVAQVKGHFENRMTSATYDTLYPPQTITVDVENILVTATVPANPDVLTWNPDTDTTKTLSVTFSSAFRAPTTITLTLYDSAQRQIKTYTLPSVPVGLDSTTYSFVWDGTQDASGPGAQSAAGGGASPSSVPGPSGPTLAPKGIYLFRFFAQRDYAQDNDSDKSTFLSLSASNPYAACQSDDGTTSVWLVSYTLTPNPARPASEGHVTVYASDLSVYYTQTLTSDQLTPGSHSVLVSMPSDTDWHLFLIHARDSQNLNMAANDSNYDAKDKDKGHRERETLEEDNKVKMYALNFDFSGYRPIIPPGTTPYADPSGNSVFSGALWQSKDNYNILLPLSADHTNKSARYALDKLVAKNAQGVADTATRPTLFSVFGHGGAFVSINYQTFWTGEVGNPDGTLNGSSSWSLMLGGTGLVGTIERDNPPWKWNNATSATLGSLGAADLAHVVLAAFIGCHTSSTTLAASTLASPPQSAVEKGAKYAIGFTDEIPSHWTGLDGTFHKGTEEWAASFWYYLNNQKRDINYAWQHALIDAGLDMVQGGLKSLQVWCKGDAGSAKRDNDNMGKGFVIPHPLTP